MLQSKNMLAGLISRCTMPRLCRYCRASAIWVGGGGRGKSETSTGTQNRGEAVHARQDGQQEWHQVYDSGVGKPARAHELRVPLTLTQLSAPSSPVLPP